MRVRVIVAIAAASIVLITLGALSYWFTDWFRPDVDPYPITGDAPPRLELVADGFEQPVLLLNDTYVVEQGGTIRDLEGDVWLDVRDRVQAGGERGLLGAAIHADRLYLHYSDNAGDTVLSKVPLSGPSDDAPWGRPDAGSETILLTRAQPYGNHNGGMVAFGPDGYLYLGLGDGGAAGDPGGNGQDKDTILGAILRLDVSGDEAVAAPGNPFIDEAGDDRIWAYGLRNPWRFSFDRVTGDLWIGDVGQDVVEEIDRIPAGDGGANLGWNRFEGSQRFRPGNAPGHVAPVAEYDHDGGHCSVTGGYVWHHEDAGAYEGDYIFGDYCSGWLWRHDPASGDTERILDTDLHVSSFSEGTDGTLYVIHHGGSIHRLHA